MQRYPREVNNYTTGQASTDPLTGTISASRAAMLLTHQGQAPILEDNEPRWLITGTDMRYAEHTFDIRFPQDVNVLRVLRKYPTGLGSGAIRVNPVYTIIYENYYDKFKTVGVIHVPEFNSFHQDFGYELKKNQPVWDRILNIREGHENLFAKDEVIASSTAVKANGLYGTGLNVPVACMSVPSGIEDGFLMAKSLLKRMSPRIYNTVVANVGRKYFLLNMYGDSKTYKPFADIGEKIRADGVVFAMRALDDLLAPADMTPAALRTIDQGFDLVVYGKAGATVKDITVYHDDRTNPTHTPLGMDAQMRKYYDVNAAYYREVLREYDRLLARRRTAKSSRDTGARPPLHVTPEFDQLVTEAKIYLPVPEKERKLNRMYRLETLDEWRVELTYEAIMEPAQGYKATDFHGGKGVNCKTVDDECMPVDENGNRAQLVFYGGSTIRRMNFGRLYEQFFNAASRDLLHRLRAQAGLQPKLKPTAHQVAMVVNNPSLVEPIYNTLMRYYEILAPLQFDILNQDPDPAHHVKHVLTDGIYLYMPVDNPINLRIASKTIMESEFCPHHGPVQYVDTEGNLTTTKKKVLIGDLYIMMLEKIGEDWSGVASVRVQQLGLPAKLNNQDKLGTPGREQPVRSMGESETRSYISNVGPMATMNLIDQTNNPASHRAVVESILRAPQPSNIAQAVDRRKTPYGGSRPVQLCEHLMECRGVRFRYRPAN